MKSISIDAIGPLPKDNDNNSYILVIIDNFSKYTMLFACKSVTALEYVKALVQFVGIFGITRI